MSDVGGERMGVTCTIIQEFNRKEGHPPPGFALLRDVGVCPRGRSVKEPLRVSGNFAGEERKRKGDMKSTKGIRCKRKKNIKIKRDGEMMLRLCVLPEGYLNGQ
ncbi:hypothetical protein PV325_008194 [Microctonus aethiopoides]|nr:hypothetical protein PV325_008194 [Microctonus aethiopoides]